MPYTQEFSESDHTSDKGTTGDHAHREVSAVW